VGDYGVLVVERAATYDLSVVKLAKIIDAWIEQFESAIIWWNMHGSAGPEALRDDRKSLLLWCLYFGDLRHAEPLMRVLAS